MTQQSIIPNNRDHWLQLRSQDITSTEISALFNLSPYTTEFELWHQKKNNTITELEPNDRVLWGTRLQNAIAQGIAEDEGWWIREMKEYIRIPELRLGSSFDFIILSEPSEKPMTPAGVAEGLLEIKNVDSLIHKQQWIEHDDGLEAPPHIELQAQHQMLVSGYRVNYIGALIGGNRVVLIKRTADTAVQDAIKSKAAEFWKSVDSGTPPAIDFERDAEFIGQLYNYAEPGKIIDIKNDAYITGLASNYRDISERIKSLESNKDALKAEILMKIGIAEKCLGSEFTISAGVVGPARIEYDRKPYRNFRINWRKSNV